MQDQTINQDLVEADVKQDKPSNKKNFIIAGIVALVIVVIAVVVVVVVVMTKKDKKSVEMTATVKTVNFTLPEGAVFQEAHYLSTGRILVQYQFNTSSTHYYLAVMNDDGTNVTDIWNGEGRYYKSNGFRILPFTDNKRILVGDYVIECTPSLDDCNHSEAILIEYPEEIVNDSRVLLLWSEVIVSQDSEHIAWSTLGNPFGAVNFIGRLSRSESTYTVSNVKMISNSEFFEKSGEFLKEVPIRGGEIKQFTNGGTAVSVAGSTRTGLAKSILQDLSSEDVTALSHEPGYEETTILSPDTKLGITMSTRNSPKTNLAILGLVPVPNDVIVTANLNYLVYTFAITNVRNGKHRGNIGPVLANMEQSINDPNYHGIGLHDESENWTFCSPLSWHPSSTKAIWPETANCGPDKGKNRLRMVEISGYDATQPVPTQPTPENISYAKDISDFKNMSDMTFVGRVNGKEGYIDINRTQVYSYATYVNYTEDGSVYYNGTMSYETTAERGGKFVANITGINSKGERESIMDFRLKFASTSDLLFDLDDDGKPMSYGSATYKDKTINVDQYK